MRSLIRAVAICLLALGAGACATGPKYAEVRNSIPQVAPDQGRIYFYRSGVMFGAAIQPEVKLNGTVVGNSKPGGFFYVDVPPSDYEVVLSTETDKKASFVLPKGEERCIRMSVGLGVLVYRVYPELVDTRVCKDELQDLSYTGTTAQR